MSKIWAIIVVYCIGYHAGFSQEVDFSAIMAEVDFSRTLQEWDGFGFNYVETILLDKEALTWMHRPDL